MSQQILVVEDEPAIADTIIYALSSDGFKVTCVGTAQEALKTAANSEFALAVLDIGLPDGSGFELLRKLREFSFFPVIFLSARSDEVDRVAGLEMGADDYLVKPFSPRELVARVRTVLRRVESKQANPANEVGDFRHIPEKHLIQFRQSPLSLSRIEYRLLLVLLKSPGRVFSREQLMSLAWEEPEMSLERTVDAHIKSIRAKLKEIAPDSEEIITHRGFGYSLREVES